MCLLILLILMVCFVFRFGKSLMFFLLIQITHRPRQHGEKGRYVIFHWPNPETMVRFWCSQRQILFIFWKTPLLRINVQFLVLPLVPLGLEISPTFISLFLLFFVNQNLTLYYISEHYFRRDKTLNSPRNRTDVWRN